MKKYTLPKEFAEKWIKALRSGDYKQGDEMLMTYSEEYCCLGLACKIAGITPKSGYTYGFPYDLQRLEKFDLTALPELLREECAGIYNLDKPANEQVNFNCTVARLNDSGYTFIEIADWIESNTEFV